MLDLLARQVHLAVLANHVAGAVQEHSGVIDGRTLAFVMPATTYDERFLASSARVAVVGPGILSATSA